MALGMGAMCRLAAHGETYWSRIKGNELCGNVQILIVSAVKICKLCLQTVSAFEGLKLLWILHHWAPLRDFRPPDTRAI